jgi:hypothetical protein
MEEMSVSFFVECATGALRYAANPDREDELLLDMRRIYMELQLGSKKNDFSFRIE